MWTSVYRDILDKSISGDKIFGGSINWVDALYADALVIPHDGGAGGNGSINGTNFAIGNVDPIYKVAAKYFTLHGNGSYLKAFKTGGVTESIHLGLVGANAQFLLRANGGTTIVKLNPDDSFNYIVTKLLVGKSTETSSTYKFEVNGTAYATKWATTNCHMDANNVSAKNVYFNFASPLTPVWANVWYTEYLALKAEVDAYASNLNLITSDIITNALKNIEDLTIDNTNWASLAELNQDVGINSDPVFGEPTTANIYSLHYDLEGVGAKADSIDGYAANLDLVTASIISDCLATLSGIQINANRWTAVSNTMHEGPEWVTDTITIMGGSGLSIAQYTAKTVLVSTVGLFTPPYTDPLPDDTVLVLRAGTAGWGDDADAGLVLTGVVVTGNQIKYGIANITIGIGYVPNSDDRVVVRILRKSVQSGA